MREGNEDGEEKLSQYFVFCSFARSDTQIYFNSSIPRPSSLPLAHLNYLFRGWCDNSEGCRSLWDAKQEP